MFKQYNKDRKPTGLQFSDMGVELLKTIPKSELKFWFFLIDKFPKIGEEFYLLKPQKLKLMKEFKLGQITSIEQLISKLRDRLIIVRVERGLYKLNADLVFKI